MTNEAKQVVFTRYVQVGTDRCSSSLVGWGGLGQLPPLFEEEAIPHSVSDERALGGNPQRRGMAGGAWRGRSSMARRA